MVAQSKVLILNYKGISMKFDLHCHTTYSKLVGSIVDSNITPKQLVEISMKRNLDGIAVTDHDTFDAYPLVKKMARKIDPDFIVIPGIEIGNQKFGHILVLGIEELPNSKDVEESLDFARQSGATIVLSHPFTPLLTLRSKFSFDEMKKFDGMEILNSYDWNMNNGRNKRIVDLLKLGITAGSDCHRPRNIGLFYTVCQDPLKDIKKKKTKVGGIDAPWSFKIAGLLGLGLI